MSIGLRISLIAVVFGLSLGSGQAQDAAARDATRHAGRSADDSGKDPVVTRYWRGGNLSEKLDKSDGVIKPPPGVDPHMAKPAPPTPQTMPVIRPPEEKGGPVAK